MFSFCNFLLFLSEDKYRFHSFPHLVVNVPATHYQLKNFNLSSFDLVVEHNFYLIIKKVLAFGLVKVNYIVKNKS